MITNYFETTRLVVDPVYMIHVKLNNCMLTILRSKMHLRNITRIGQVAASFFLGCSKVNERIVDKKYFFCREFNASEDPRHDHHHDQNN